MSNTHAKFCFNNWIETGLYTTSSSQSSYPSANLVSGFRSKTWRPSGLFEISASNNKVYLNSSTYTVPVGSYSVTTLITAFNTATGQTLSRNSLGRFVITLGASGTLDLATTTNAIWSVLGFLGSSNLSGTAFTADERRYSTGEWLLIDMGTPQEASFAALIPPAEESFTVSAATIKLQANNVLDWTSPPVDAAMSVDSKGAFYSVPDTTAAYRYWRILIDDVKNDAIAVAVAYIGDGVIPTSTNISSGFSRSYEDQSVVMQSENGQLFVDRRPRRLNLSTVQVQMLQGTDLVELEQLVFDLGVGRPFFLVIDPSVAVSSSLSEMTHYVFVDQPPSFQHVFRGYYNLNISLKEAI